MKTETIGIRVTPEEKEMVKKIAADKGMTISQLVHFIIFKEYFQK